MDVKPTRVIAIASGKGGVGKSFLTFNLAEALAKMGQRVAILDADFGLANIELLASATPAKDESQKTIVDVLNGDCAIKDILVNGPAGIKIIPGGRGNPALAEPDCYRFLGLVSAIDPLAGEIDYLLVDTAGGLSPTDLQLLQAAGEVLVVITPEPLSQSDAADYISTLRRHCGIQQFGIVANMTRRQREGHSLMAALQQRISFEQDLVLRYCGHIPLEPEVARLADRFANPYANSFSKNWHSLQQAHPDSKATRSLQMLAEVTNRKIFQPPQLGGITFFLEQSVSAGGI